MKMMYKDSIEFSCSGEEESRYARLQRVIGYVYALAEHSGNTSILDKIESFNDHEGQLTVKWKTPATDGEKELFIKAWKSSIGDSTSDVIHIT